MTLQQLGLLKAKHAEVWIRVREADLAASSTVEAHAAKALTDEWSTLCRLIAAVELLHTHAGLIDGLQVSADV